MPAIANGRVLGSGELSTDSSSLVDALCTSPALDDGVDYFVFGQANHRNDGAATHASQLEARFGSTRLGVSTWRSIFGNFNVGDDVGGACPAFMSIVTGNGSDTLNMRAAGVDNGAEENIRVGGQAWTYFALTELDEGTDYDSAIVNSDTISATPTTDTWISGSSSGQLTITPAETGDWLIFAYCEAVADPAAAGTNEIRVRLRLVEDPSGTPSESTIGFGAEQVSSISGTDPDHFSPSLTEIDVRTLTGGTTYRIQWEFQNAESNDGIGYRRERVIALRLARFRGSAYITNGGGIVDLAGAETEAANGLTHDFSPGGEDVLVFASAASQNDGTWSDHWLRLDGTPDVDFPGGAGAGYMHAMVTTDFPGADIITVPQSGRLAEASGSQTWRLVAQADLSPGLTYGRDRGNTTDTRAVVVALEMFVDTNQLMEATVSASGSTQAGGGAIEALFAAVDTTGSTQAEGSLAFGLEAEATASGSTQAGGAAVFPMEAEATVTGATQAGGSLAIPLSAEVTAAGSTQAGGVAVSPMEAEISATGSTQAGGRAVFPVEAEVAASGSTQAGGAFVSAVDELLGTASDELELRVHGLDQYGQLLLLRGDTRPVRFDLLDVDGAAVDPDLIDTIAVKVRRASNPPGATSLTPTQDAETVDDVAYGWAVDLGSTITVAGLWVLEVDVELVDGSTATWPSAGPLRIRAVEQVG